jgi:hypothetical protein
MIPKDYGVQKIGKHEFGKVFPGLSIQFVDVSPGYPEELLPAHYGQNRAQGRFDTRIDLPEREMKLYDVTEEEVIEYLDTHRQNAANDEPGEKIFVRIDNQAEVLNEDSYIVPYGDSDSTERWCNLCEKVVDVRGLPKHREGKTHTELLALAEKEALSA